MKRFFDRRCCFSNVINGRQIVLSLRLRVERLAANGRDAGSTQRLGALGDALQRHL
jgi:hypothetical protein